MSTSLTDYLFSIGEAEQIQIHFTVTARTQTEAVEKANKALSEEDEGHSFTLYGPAKDGYMVINSERVRVTAKNIINESPSWLSPPEKAFAFLEERGYDWGGSEDWAQDLMETGEGIWNYTYATSEGIYGMLKIEVRPEYNIKDWVFRYSLWMYPMAQWNIEHGKVGYKVQIDSAHYTMTEEELIKWLPRFEKKFAELAFVLRQADPEDGYPLLPEEAAAGHIINVDWRTHR